LPEPTTRRLAAFASCEPTSQNLYDEGLDEVENAGLLNVHVKYYTHRAAPELPRLRPPVRLQRIASVDVGRDQHITSPNRVAIPVSGCVPINIEAGNSSWAIGVAAHERAGTQRRSVGRQRHHRCTDRRVPGRADKRQRAGRADTADRTAVDAPAPQGRQLLEFDSRAFSNGDYELFMSYGDEIDRFDAAELSGAYYSIPIRIQN